MTGGPPTLHVVDYVCWRMWLGSIIDRGCRLLDHPCIRWVPFYRLINWAVAIEDTDRNVVVSVAITTKQATRLLPHLNGRHDDDHSDHEEVRHDDSQTSPQGTSGTDHAPAPSPAVGTPGADPA